VYSRTFESRNGLSFVGVFTIERESHGQRLAQTPKTLERLLSRSIVAYFELAITGYANHDLISFLQLKRLNDRGGRRTARLLPTLRLASMASGRLIY